MAKDIATPEDIRLLVDKFYEKVVADPLLGPIFNEIAQVDWPKHLPKMYAFWEFLLIGSNSYNGNPIQKHFELHAKNPITDAQFDQWLAHFCSTVDDLFAGEKAEEAKMRAAAIAGTWRYKFTHHG